MKVDIVGKSRLENVGACATTYTASSIFYFLMSRQLRQRGFPATSRNFSAADLPLVNNH